MRGQCNRESDMKVESLSELMEIPRIKIIRELYPPALIIVAANDGNKV